MKLLTNTNFIRLYLQLKVELKDKFTFKIFHHQKQSTIYLGKLCAKSTLWIDPLPPGTCDFTLTHRLHQIGTGL